MKTLDPGVVLANRYRIVKVLGTGGTSTVYLADDAKLNGKRWALKEIRFDPKDAGRFMAEAGMMTRLNHAHLPDIVDVFGAESGYCGYVVMDYIEGPTLKEQFEQYGRKLPVRLVAGYALQLCEVLRYLHEGHEKPIIYRDLKPSNIMIDRSGLIKLVDFGIARSFTEGSSADTVRIGTVGFAAPEQFGESQSDVRTDLYSLGAVMYFLLSGGGYYYSMQKPLRQLNADVPDMIAAIVGKLLRTDPQERFQSAAEVKRSLERWLQSESGGDSAVPSALGAPSAPKVVVVCSLYPGAGATFTALGIAKALEIFGYGSAVIEGPRDSPELYGLLFGERNMPAGYRYYTETDTPGAVWGQEAVAWYPLPPQSGGETSWSAERRLMLFYKTKKPFIVIDAGTQWLSADYAGVTDEADTIVAVVDPFVHKLAFPQAAARIKELERLAAAGKQIHYIANKTPQSSSCREWYQLLPQTAICAIPFIDHETAVGACWNGTLVQDRPEVLRVLEKSLQPLLSGWAPRRGRKRWGWLGRRGDADS
ncbi:serine/threonine protein kinase [Paenibacillus thalictri]|uniref:serine/threonine protein kinase n=1 Tax=Paenibacillus thalictri TaxID=2527873 RepID=UPI0013EF4701|nr:serine/threonine-protein kinase [Paenibacillus thalictri]